MTKRDWMLKYAPNGYYYTKTRIPFEVLDNAVFPADIVRLEVDRLEQKLVRDYRAIPRKADTLTLLTVYPKQIGESLGRLDPLVPRHGIEIEIRQPRMSDPYLT